ncbi:MAG: M3 family oligoendopeptidase [Bacilli bacterium]|nr:M3 family oligoendopeptidase [Bacilli bacterium]
MEKELPVFEKWPYRMPDMEKAEKQIREFAKRMENAKDEAEALKIWKANAKLSDKLNNEISHIQVLFTLNSLDPKYKRDNDRLDETIPLISAADNCFIKATMNSPFREYLEKKLGTYLFKMYDYSLRSFDEKIVEDSIEENKLCSEYGALLASAKIEFRGETYNLSQMGKFMEDLDRNTRKEASKAYYAYLDTIADKLEDIYSKLVLVRDRMAKKLGYENYIELGYLRMGRYDYNKDDVASYREAIGEVVTPIVSKLTKEQFKRTKIRHPEVYDLNILFLDGNATPMGTTEEKVERAREMYGKMSEETSYWFNFMADHHLLDLEARAGKQTGGYMTEFPVYGVPFIFSNFNGTAGDVDVLTHEFGHSFQYCMSRKIAIPEYRMPTMESCEIHSMSMEFLAEPYMDLFFDNAEKYRYQHLFESIAFLPYGVSVDEFQHFAYENPNATPEERDAKWHEIEMKYTPYKVACYGDCEYMKKGRRWLVQRHIFESPFYYIDYTLAQIMAFQFFNLDRKNHVLAWKKYLKLCKMGGTYPFRTLVKKDGMKDPFESGVIKKTISPLVKQLKTYKF